MQSMCFQSYHEAFLRSRPDLIFRMTRRLKEGKRTSHPSKEPDFYRMCFLPDITNIADIQDGSLSSHDRAHHAVSSLFRNDQGAISNIKPPQSFHAATSQPMMGMSTPTYRSLASFQQHGSNTYAELENLSSNYSSLWLEGSLNRDDIISVNHSIPPLNLGMDHTLHPGQQSIVSSNPPSHPTLGQFAHQYSCNFATENMVDERANTGLLNQQATNATIVSQPPREVSEQQSRTMGRLSAASIAMLSNPPNHPLLQQFAEQYLPYFSS